MDGARGTAASQACAVCGNVGLTDGDDGFFFCAICGSQAEDIVDTAIADEDFVQDLGGHGRDALYSARHTRRAPPINARPISQVPGSLSLYHSLSQAMDAPVGSLGPTQPSDFAPGNGVETSIEDYYNNVRTSYVYGLQLMINYQCEALVEKFNVSPLICGISGSIWLRYVRSTRVFDDGWADEVRLDSQLEGGGCNKTYTTKTGGKNEPRNAYNQRMVVLWYKSLRKMIPLSCSLAITYLSCHIAREAVLPTDIQRWTLEGKLPYLAAFVEIEKKIRSTRECPLSGSYMFRPSQAVPLQKLESLAANIAQSVGLTLPPVNFSGIASRYLKKLSLPVEKILPYAHCIHDWSMPPGLWLSTCESRLPTRVCVMAVLIITVRTLYNLNGLGKWEASLSGTVGSTCINKSAGGLDSLSESQPEDNTEVPHATDEETNDASEVHKLEHEAVFLLGELQKRCSIIIQTLDCSKDLETYLRYCNDVVFGGLNPSFEDYVEEKMIKRFWNFYGEKEYEGQEDDNVGTNQGKTENDEVDTRPRKSSSRLQQMSDADEPSTSNCEPPSNNLADIAIRLMKQHMEENRFYYIPPRKRVKRLDYLHYVRKRDDGSLTYAAHADYYILLHACAKEAQVDIRIMHQGVLSLERRLAWIEKRVDNCLHESST